MLERNDLNTIISIVNSLVGEKQKKTLQKGRISSFNQGTGEAIIHINDQSFIPVTLDASAGYYAGDEVLLVETGAGDAQGNMSVVAKISGSPNPPGGNELIANGDVRYGTQSWSSNEFCSAAINADNKISGNFSLKITPLYAFDECYIYQDIFDLAVVPGEIYLQKATFYTDSTDGVTIFLDGDWYDQDFNRITNVPFIKSQSLVITSEDNWVTLYTYNRAPIDGTHARCKFCAIFPNTTDSLYVDNLSFVGKSQALPSKYFFASSSHNVSNLVYLYDASTVSFASLLPSGTSAEECWVEYEYPEEHTFYKTTVNFTSGQHSFFLGYSRDNQTWKYIGGSVGGYTEYTDFYEPSGVRASPIITSETTVTVGWPQMREARFVRFYLASGNNDNYEVSELTTSSLIYADSIFAGDLILDKGIRILDNYDNPKVTIDSSGATFHDSKITVYGSGGTTMIEGGNIKVSSSGEDRDLNDFFDIESSVVKMLGSEIKTKSVKAQALEVSGPGYFKNVLKNPSFEVPTSDGSFALSWNASGGTTTYKLNPEMAKVSKHYIECSGASQQCASDFVSLRTTESTASDFKYVLSTYAATEVSGHARLRVAQYDGADTPALLVGQEYQTIVDMFPSGSEEACSYTRIYGIYIPPSGCQSIKLLLETTSGSCGKTRFDAAQIEEGDILTDFTVNYGLGSVIIDPDGIVVDHPNEARTTINEDGITIERGNLYVNTPYGLIDVIDEIKIGTNLIYNPTFDLTKYDGTKLIIEGWDYTSSGTNVTWSLKTTPPEYRGAVGGKYIEANTSGASAGQYARFVSMKLPVESNIPLAYQVYYYVPSGSSNISATAKVYVSQNFIHPLSSGYSFATDTLLNSGSYALSPCASGLSWGTLSIDDLQYQGASTGYIYTLLTIEASGANPGSTMKIASTSLEVGDKVTSYGDHLEAFIGNKFSLYKYGMVLSHYPRFVISGILGTKKP